MLLVVLGAGASYDSISSDPPHSGGERNPQRLPLASALFEDRPQFTRALNAFGRAAPLFPVLHSGGGNEGVEAALERIWNRSPRRPETIQQFTALRYYIQNVIRTTEELWLGSRQLRLNHIALIDQIVSARPGIEPVLFVTFNYDTLIERALDHFGVKIERFEDYSSASRFKVFKLHGSTNWFRLASVRLRPNDLAGTDVMVRRMIDEAGNYELIPNYLMETTRTRIEHLHEGCVPAIAVPTQTKAGFECPDGLVIELANLLPKVDHILTIGWRASDPAFLDLLRKHVTNRVRLSVVAESTTAADQTTARLRTVLVLGLCQSIGRTFSGFIEDQWAADNLGPTA